jgi:hypothetical protein
MTGQCPGCNVRLRIPPAEVERVLAEYLRNNTQPLAEPDEADRRLAICQRCPDLRFGSTCRHCGCLVAVRTRLAGQSCPALPARW